MLKPTHISVTLFEAFPIFFICIPTDVRDLLNRKISYLIAVIRYNNVAFLRPYIKVCVMLTPCE
jgi:hypothetical protein